MRADRIWIGSPKVEYLRADLYEALRKENAELEAMLKDIAGFARRRDEKALSLEDSLDEAQLMIHEIVAYFDVIKGKYEGRAQIDLSADWPSDWLRRARAHKKLATSPVLCENPRSPESPSELNLEGKSNVS